MKIGILTLPFNNNYGGYLQCYALMTVLKREGHEVELIYRRHPKAPISQKVVPTIKNLIKVLIGQKVVSLIPDEEKSFRYQGASMMPFFDNCISPKSKPLYSSRDFIKYVSGRFDAVIVGSDQVWRPEYGPGIRDYFFYGIPDNALIRLSYAASFGTDKPQFNAEELSDCKKALSKFKAVSVREKSGLEALKAFDCEFNTEPQVVLDPTLLLEQEDYNIIIKDGISPSKGKVFCYVLDTNQKKDAIINGICNRLNKNKYAVADIQSSNTSLPSIETWLSAIRDSDFVVTDSFHGMVFSVIFQKEFLVCPNINRGADRFTSFLQQLGLEERIVDSLEKINITPIDWESVKRVLSEKKNTSLDFIKKNLK